MTDQSDNRSYGQPGVPDPNQAKPEPVGNTPETSVAQAGEASRVPGEQGDPPRDIQADDSAGAQQMVESVGPPVDGGVPSPGNAQGVSVPSVQAAAGTSEQSEQVDGVKITALAPPAKPDGEVDTRPSSTPL